VANYDVIGGGFFTQDGLKRRMDKLRQSIEEASVAVDREREKNVSLLHLIFPEDIAKRLWLGILSLLSALSPFNDFLQLKSPSFDSLLTLSGESIEAKTHENVTMLFSDIVGFTSICSTATPMQVVTMLQSLYTQFDAFCGQLDVYKVSVHTLLPSPTLTPDYSMQRLKTYGYSSGESRILPWVVKLIVHFTRGVHLIKIIAHGVQINLPFVLDVEMTKYLCMKCFQEQD